MTVSILSSAAAAAAAALALHKTSFSTELALITMPILRFGCFCLVLFGFLFCLCLLPFVVGFFCFLFFQYGIVTVPQDCVVGPQPHGWVHQCAVMFKTQTHVGPVPPHLKHHE